MQLTRHMGYICRPDVRKSLELESYQSCTDFSLCHDGWSGLGVNTFNQLCLHLGSALGPGLTKVKRLVSNPVLELVADTETSWAGAGTKKRDMKELCCALENFMELSERWGAL